MKLKNNLEVVIRELENKDAEAAVSYLNSVGGESDFLSFGENEFKLTIEEESLFIENMKKRENAILLGAFYNEELIAIANLSGLSDWNRQKHRAVLGITIRKTFWNLGLGKEMMRQLLSFASNHEYIEIIELQVSTENLIAIALYESFGFETVGKAKRFFKIGTKSCDAYYMQLDLKSK